VGRSRETPPVGEIQWRARPAERLLPELEAKLPVLRASAPFDIGFTDVLDLPVFLVVRLPRLDRIRFEELIEWGKLDLAVTHQGKGLTAVQSRVSALMETVERFSAGAPPAADRVRVAAHRDLGAQALNPADFDRPAGVHYDPSLELTWVEAADLIGGGNVLCPVDLALIDLPDSAYPFQGFQTRRLGFYWTNGLSAGSDAREAAASGILEVIERDAQHRILQGTDVPTQLDLSADPYSAAWAEWFAVRGLELRAFWAGRLEGFQTVIAAVWDPYCRNLTVGSAGARTWGFGLQQAVLEAAQQRAFMFFKRWKTRRAHFPIVRYIEERIRPESYRDRVPPDFWTERAKGPAPPGDLADDRPWDLDSILADLPDAHRPAALDLTHPDLGSPVVRVLIPGLKNAYMDWPTGLGFLKEE
jgi:ribosomal protein S12 methylthiotransferase accessory factor